MKTLARAYYNHAGSIESRVSVLHLDLRIYRELAVEKARRDFEQWLEIVPVHSKPYGLNLHLRVLDEFDPREPVGRFLSYLLDECTQLRALQD